MFENHSKKAKAKRPRPEDSVKIADHEMRDQQQHKKSKNKSKGDTNNSNAADLSDGFRAAFKHSMRANVLQKKQVVHSAAKRRENENQKLKQDIHKMNLATSSPEPEIDHGIKKGLSELQLKFQKKLEGARFRALNEKLYSANGAQSFSEFQEDPSLFREYHEGYREQVKSWPVNPLDVIISWIKTKHSHAVVADLGCGEAMLAASVCSTNTVYSFDLVAANHRVTACDISNLPLRNASIDIVVFCLSLMGTNIADFLKEAHRILKPGGILKIAEVRSRFEGVKDGIKKFFRVLKKAGFDSTDKNFDNKMFFLSESVKSSRPATFDAEYSARVCLYKKR